MRKEQQPIIEKGREIFDNFLKENNIDENNEVFTKIIGTMKFRNRDELFTALGSGETSFPSYLVKMLGLARKLIHSALGVCDCDVSTST